MAKAFSSGGNKSIESNPKKTSIGNGRRKEGSFKLKSKKKYRGQGK
tara:strand:+ start:2710 stop:2847 length:138 start_codon:yes stop_codon:yes gene_type:complete